MLSVANMRPLRLALPVLLTLGWIAQSTAFATDGSSVFDSKNRRKHSRMCPSRSPVLTVPLIQTEGISDIGDVAELTPGPIGYLEIYLDD